MKKYSLGIVTLLTLFGSTTCLSQQEIFNEFLPEGYIIFEKIYGDLNNDGLEDCVIITKGTDKKNINSRDYRGELDYNRRGIMIFLNTGNNYELTVSNLDCFSSENEDGGVYFPPELWMKIENGNLYVSYSHGRYGNWKYTFKYQDSDFVLIGYDSSTNYGPVVQYQTSINFLTNKKLNRENINKNVEDGEEIFKEIWETIEAKELIKISDIEDFDQLQRYIY